MRRLFVVSCNRTASKFALLLQTPRRTNSDCIYRLLKNSGNLDLKVYKPFMELAFSEWPNQKITGMNGLHERFVLFLRTVTQRSKNCELFRLQYV
jgi:hypothetical protein